MLSCATSEQYNVCRTFMSQEFMKHAWAEKKHPWQTCEGLLSFVLHDVFSGRINPPVKLHVIIHRPEKLLCTQDFLFFSAEVQSVSNFLWGHCATGMMKPPLGMVIDIWWLPGGWTPASSTHSNTPPGYAWRFCWKQPMRQVFMLSSTS